ncbi:DUF1616 domain-containing protein [Halomarina salina]|uniref:DUF1616 domain-containing protein n=1 Tax=Halomarina salina TaxID=1872699 RepID=A0ABD5RI60_9EURY
MADKQTQNERSVRTNVALSTVDQFVDVVAILLFLVVLQAAIRSVEPTGLFGLGGPLRVAVTLVALLFLPGYALTTVLFPTHPRHGHEDRLWISPTFEGRLPDAPALGERLLLSFGLSLAVVPLAGMGLSVLSLGYDPQTVGNATTLLVVLPLLLGTIRRLQMPEERRYLVSLQYTLRQVGGGLRGTTRADTLSNVAVVLGVVAVVVVSALAITAPQSGAGYTDFSLLSENGQGEFVADDYPAEFVAGESQALTFRVADTDPGETSYEVVVVLERVDDNGGVTERAELDRYRHTVDDGPWVRQHSVTPSMTGDDLRLTYLLYDGEAPSNPKQANADQSLYVWVSVSNGN